MTQNLDTWPSAPWTRVPASHKDAMEGFERQAAKIKGLPKGAVPLAGWKIGTSDPLTQHRFGLSTCLLGHLPGNTECDSTNPVSLDDVNSNIREHWAYLQ